LDVQGQTLLVLADLFEGEVALEPADFLGAARQGRALGLQLLFPFGEPPHVFGGGGAEEDEAEALAQQFQVTGLQILDLVSGQRRLQHPQVVLHGVPIHHLLKHVLNECGRVGSAQSSIDERVVVFGQAQRRRRRTGLERRGHGRQEAGSR